VLLVALGVAACVQPTPAIAPPTPPPVQLVDRTARTPAEYASPNATLLMVDSLRRGIPGVVVRLGLPEGSRTARVTGVTDSAGAFRLTSIEAGAHRTVAMMIGYKPVTWTLRIRPGGVDTMTVAMEVNPLRLEGLCAGTNTDHVIVLDITDSLTGAPAADGAVAIARDGAYVDTLRSRDRPEHPPGTVLSGVAYRQGTYDITVTKPGYRAWTRTGVVVTYSNCVFSVQRLQVRLQPM
jgi:hypothetical protein